VTRPDATRIAGPEGTLLGDPALQAALRQHERSAAAPAGSLFVYGIDIYHRGTNLTAPGGHRYVMTVCFKNARNAAINYVAWPFHHRKPWEHIFDHASPEQLACFGVQRPGDPLLDRDHHRPRPGPLSELGHDALSRGPGEVA
jgi:hypothetical protein